MTEEKTKLTIRVKSQLGFHIASNSNAAGGPTGTKSVNTTHFSNFLLHFLPFICYKQFTESRCVATPVVFVKLLVSSGI
jgi:hypothetical protein